MNCTIETNAAIGHRYDKSVQAKGCNIAWSERVCKNIQVSHFILMQSRYQSLGVVVALPLFFCTLLSAAELPCYIGS